MLAGYQVIMEPDGILQPCKESFLPVYVSQAEAVALMATADLLNSVTAEASGVLPQRRINWLEGAVCAVASEAVPGSLVARSIIAAAGGKLVTEDHAVIPTTQLCDKQHADLTDADWAGMAAEACWRARRRQGAGPTSEGQLRSTLERLARLAACRGALEAVGRRRARLEVPAASGSAPAGRQQQQEWEGEREQERKQERQRLEKEVKALQQQVRAALATDVWALVGGWHAEAAHLRRWDADAAAQLEAQWEQRLAQTAAPVPVPSMPGSLGQMQQAHRHLQQPHQEQQQQQRQQQQQQEQRQQQVLHSQQQQVQNQLQRQPVVPRPAGAAAPQSEVRNPVGPQVRVKPEPVDAGSTGPSLCAPPPAPAVAVKAEPLVKAEAGPSAAPGALGPPAAAEQRPPKKQRRTDADGATTEQQPLAAASPPAKRAGEPTVASPGPAAAEAACGPCRPPAAPAAEALQPSGSCPQPKLQPQLQLRSPRPPLAPAASAGAATERRHTLLHAAPPSATAAAAAQPVTEPGAGLAPRAGSLASGRPAGGKPAAPGAGPVQLPADKAAPSLPKPSPFVQVRKVPAPAGPHHEAPKSPSPSPATTAPPTPPSQREAAAAPPLRRKRSSSRERPAAVQTAAAPAPACKVVALSAYPRSRLAAKQAGPRFGPPSGPGAAAAETEEQYVQRLHSFVRENPEGIELGAIKNTPMAIPQHLLVTNGKAVTPLALLRRHSKLLRLSVDDWGTTLRAADAPAPAQPAAAAGQDLEALESGSAYCQRLLAFLRCHPGGVELNTLKRTDLALPKHLAVNGVMMFFKHHSEQFLISSVNRADGGRPFVVVRARYAAAGKRAAGPSGGLDTDVVMEDAWEGCGGAGGASDDDRAGGRSRAAKRARSRSRGRSRSRSRSRGRLAAAFSGPDKRLGGGEGAGDDSDGDGDPFLRSQRAAALVGPRFGPPPGPGAAAAETEEQYVRRLAAFVRENPEGIELGAIRGSPLAIPTHLLARTKPVALLRQYPHLLHLHFEDGSGTMLRPAALTGASDAPPAAPAAAAAAAPPGVPAPAPPDGAAPAAADRPDGRPCAAPGSEVRDPGRGRGADGGGGGSGRPPESSQAYLRRLMLYLKQHPEGAELGRLKSEGLAIPQHLILNGVTDFLHRHNSQIRSERRGKAIVVYARLPGSGKVAAAAAAAAKARAPAPARGPPVAKAPADGGGRGAVPRARPGAPAAPTPQPSHAAPFGNGDGEGARGGGFERSASVDSCPGADPGPFWQEQRGRPRGRSRSRSRSPGRAPDRPVAPWGGGGASGYVRGGHSGGGGAAVSPRRVPLLDWEDERLLEDYVAGASDALEHDIRRYEARLVPVLLADTADRRTWVPMHDRERVAACGTYMKTLLSSGLAVPAPLLRACGGNVGSFFRERVALFAFSAHPKAGVSLRPDWREAMRRLAAPPLPAGPPPWQH